MKAYHQLIFITLFLSGMALAQEEPAAPEAGMPSVKLQFEVAARKLEGADEARDTGKLVKALNLYESAYDLYENLGELYPERDAILVEFRADYCRDQLDNIRKILVISGVGVDSSKRPEPAGASPAPPPAPAEPEQADQDVPAIVPDEVPQVRPEDPATAVASVRLPPVVLTGIAGLAAEGRVALKKGDLPRARASLMRALDENPDDKKVRLLLAMVQCRAGRFEDATYLLVELIGEMPKNAMAHVALGTAYFGMGRTADAAKLMMRAIELDDSLHEAHYNMAQIRLATKPADLDGARQYYKKALELGGKKDEKLEFLLR